jgi:hypothetical protein
MAQADSGEFIKTIFMILEKLNFCFNRRTCPKNFKLEFYANNLNKKEEERATLVKIGS